MGSVDGCEVGKVTSSLDRYAQKFGINRVTIHGATKESGIVSTYAYDACFDNVIVGGHLMKKLRARIMINGAKGICVIGNDFLNMCKYYHNAGEHWLAVENSVEQRYYESFSGKRVLHNSQLDILLSENSIGGCMLEEDDIAAETLRKSEKILKENNERETPSQRTNSTDKSPEEIEEERIRKKTEEIMKEYGLS